MLKRSDLHPYQERAVNHILYNRMAMLWLDLGLGKTVSTLTALSIIFNAGVSKGVLVLAPLRVSDRLGAGGNAMGTPTAFILLSRPWEPQAQAIGTDPAQTHLLIEL